LTLTGCETTAEKSATLEHQAKLAASHEHRRELLASFTGRSSYVRVVSATLLRGAEGAAAVITVRNSSSHALREVPIGVTVSDSGGRQLFQNNGAGTEAALVSIASIPAHGELTWVDDQIPATGSPTTVSARVGEAPVASGSVPVTSVSGLHLVEDPANGVGASGMVSNHSNVLQHALVVFVVALRGLRPIAAARAVLPELAAGTSLPFQAFFVGDPHGGTLHATAPASTIG
jgi:microcystin-dependent protein